MTMCPFTVSFSKLPCRCYKVLLVTNQNTYCALYSCLLATAVIYSESRRCHMCTPQRGGDPHAGEGSAERNKTVLYNLNFAGWKWDAVTLIAVVWEECWAKLANMSKTQKFPKRIRIYICQHFLIFEILQNHRNLSLCVKNERAVCLLILMGWKKLATEVIGQGTEKSLPFIVSVYSKGHNWAT